MGDITIRRRSSAISVIDKRAVGPRSVDSDKKPIKCDVIGTPSGVIFDLDDNNNQSALTSQIREYSRSHDTAKQRLRSNQASVSMRYTAEMPEENVYFELANKGSKTFVERRLHILVHSE